MEFEPGADLFNVVALEQRLGDLLGCRVDVVPRSSSGGAARHARRDAVPLP
ncbi:hypothetical protein MF406_06440 [Georgenia sp. TF02-10]|nr:hypothetical protein MF406_06440 [Georgenia sp. TF02-10]